MNKVLSGIVIFAVTTMTFGQSTIVDMKYSKQTTICNPLNLSYRFCLDDPSRREAADPAMVLFKEEYYLFASKSGGYWHSLNLINWDFIATADLPLEDYAPAVVIIKDTLYFIGIFQQ